MAGAEKRAAREFDLLRWQVWHAAALARVEKFPKFDTFAAQKRRKSAEELLAVARLWHAQAAAATQQKKVING